MALGANFAAGVRVKTGQTSHFSILHSRQHQRERGGLRKGSTTCTVTGTTSCMRYRAMHCTKAMWLAGLSHFSILHSRQHQRERGGQVIGENQESTKTLPLVEVSLKLFSLVRCMNCEFGLVIPPNLQGALLGHLRPRRSYIPDSINGRGVDK
jgi:hypothetical protein